MFLPPEKILKIRFGRLDVANCMPLLRPDRLASVSDPTRPIFADVD